MSLDRRKVLGVICARGGSKGVPRKNLRPLGGKPLIAHTIETACQCKWLDRVVVSTDDREIGDVALQYGAEVPFLRPAELATDHAAKWDVWRHLVTTLETTEGYICDVLVDLDPTAPLRTVDDIEASVRLLLAGDADVVFTVCESHKNPYFNMVEDRGGYAELCKTPAQPIVCRQNAPTVYTMNASIYVMWRTFLMERDGLFAGRAKMHVMPPERSVDIDREIDFQFIEFMMRRKAEVGA